jgi:hypothetical protein
MESEQGQDGWDDATNTFSSTGTHNNEDYSRNTWGDEEPAHLEEMTDEERLERLAHANSYLEEVQRRQCAEEQQDYQDPFYYTPWIAALPMPFTKEIEQGLRISGLKLRKQIQADLKRNLSEI